MRGRRTREKPRRVEKPPSAREVPRRGGGREPCHSPKYFGQPYSSLPHRLRAEPPRRVGQGVSTPFSTVCGFPLGGSCQRPRPLTDEGQPCHYYPFTACRGKLSPHPPLRATFPLGGRLLGVNPPSPSRSCTAPPYSSPSAVWCARRRGCPA